MECLLLQVVVVACLRCHHSHQDQMVCLFLPQVVCPSLLLVAFHSLPQELPVPLQASLACQACLLPLAKDSPLALLHRPASQVAQVRLDRIEDRVGMGELKEAHH